MRPFVALVVVLCVGALAAAQDKDKVKGGTARMTLVKIDAKGMTLTLKAGEQEPKEYKVTKATKFVGHRGSVTRTIEDKELKPGVVLGVVADGATLLEVNLPLRGPGKTEKDG